MLRLYYRKFWAYRWNLMLPRGIFRVSRRFWRVDRIRAVRSHGQWRGSGTFPESAE